MKKREPVIVFMDGVDFEHEIGAALGGNRVYPDLEDLVKNEPCTKSCGAVKVKIELVEWVIPQNWDKSESVTYKPDQIERDPNIQRLEGALAHLGYLEKRTKIQKEKIEALQKLIGKTND